MSKSTKKKFDVLDEEPTQNIEEEVIVSETTQATVVHDQVDVQGIPFEVWFHIRKFKKHWMKPMFSFAQSKGKKLASIPEWDELFKSY